VRNFGWLAGVLICGLREFFDGRFAGAAARSDTRGTITGPTHFLRKKTGRESHFFYGGAKTYTFLKVKWPGTFCKPRPRTRKPLSMAKKRFWPGLVDLETFLFTPRLKNAARVVNDGSWILGRGRLGWTEDEKRCQFPVNRRDQLSFGRVPPTTCHMVVASLHKPNRHAKGICRCPGVLGIMGRTFLGATQARIVSGVLADFPAGARDTIKIRLARVF